VERLLLPCFSSRRVRAHCPSAAAYHLVQIALGSIIASWANLGVASEADIFFLLFLPRFSF